MSWLGSFLVVLGFLGMSLVAAGDGKMVFPTYAYVIGLTIVTLDCPPDSVDVDLPELVDIE